MAELISCALFGETLPARPAVQHNPIPTSGWEIPWTPSDKPVDVYTVTSYRYGPSNTTAS